MPHAKHIIFSTITIKHHTRLRQYENVKLPILFLSFENFATAVLILSSVSQKSKFSNEIHWIFASILSGIDKIIVSLLQLIKKSKWKTTLENLSICTAHENGKCISSTCIFNYPPYTNISTLRFFRNFLHFPRFSLILFIEWFHSHLHVKWNISIFFRFLLPCIRILFVHNLNQCAVCMFAK